jgi:hypothetical protein
MPGPSKAHLVGWIQLMRSEKMTGKELVSLGLRTARIQ